MTRVGPSLIAIGLAMVVVAVDSESLLVAVLAAAFIVTGGALVWARRRASGEQPWTSSAAAGAAVPRRPAVPESRRVRAALGRFEARELALSPWLAVGIGLCVLMAVDFAYLSPDPLAWDEVLVSLPFLAHAPVGMVVIGSHRSAGRAERDGVRDLFDAMPTPAADRRAGVLLAAGVPVLALAAFFAAYVLGASQAAPGAEGPVGPAVPILLSGLLLGAGGVGLGVALARVWVQPVAPVLALVGIGLASPRLAQTVGYAYEPRMLLSTFPPVGENVAVLTWTQEWLHAAWLLFLTVVVFSLAMVGRRARPSASFVGAGR